MIEIIQFKNIRREFPGVIALDNVSFSIRKGEIHAIVGENGAGKTTLMHILSGIYKQDSGEVLYKGNPIVISSPQIARQLGIATVYQELKLCPNLNVAENIYLGREERTKSGRICWKKMHTESKKFLGLLEADISTRTQVKNLPIAEMQIVEIAKAMSLNAEVLILDEPTSSLTINETEVLLRNLKRLKDSGVTIIFICHRLEEVFQISERISVLRDGKYLGTFETGKITPKAVVALIAGKDLHQELTQQETRKAISKVKVALEVKNLTRGKYFKNVNFKLFQGELLGFYGLQGSGRTELMETIFGLYKQDAGEVFKLGKRITIRNPVDAIKNGFALVTEDRRRTGLFDNMDVKDNVSIVHKKHITFLSFLVKGKIVQMTKQFTKMLDVKYTSIAQKVIKLSGGNQQKVIISRWLSTNPQILLMDEPTRGIDVSAKAEIYKILRNLKANEDKSIIMVSSELPEVVAECDRVIVMHNGRIVGEFEGENITKERILHYAFSG